MSIPNYESILQPLLKIHEDNNEHVVSELIEKLSEQFDLTDEEKYRRLPSGTNKFYNRVGWAKTYLTKSNLLKYVDRGKTKITQQGLSALKENKKIDLEYLEKFEGFQEFKTATKKEISKDEEIIDTKETPIELIETGITMIRENLIDDIRNQLLAVDPYYLENIIGDLLNAMNYGECKITQKSNDKGIDGIVYQDALGISTIYFQVKRYKTPVPSKEIRDFIGSLDTKAGNKGIFITTGNLPKNPDEIVGKTTKKIKFIDGEELAELMIKYNIGVSISKTYQIKRIDTDYFIQD